VRFLIGLGRAGHLATPACSGVVESNDVHGSWIRTKLERLLTGIANPEAAVLGLTYAPGTSTLRRSSAVALCQWLVERGVAVRAHDPAVHELPEALARDVRLCQGTLETLRGADVAIIATAWPEYRELRVDDLAGVMRRATVVDQTWLLAAALATDSRIVYVAPGRPGVS
jgi:UDPglucose 6-dehydrogenase